MKEMTAKQAVVTTTAGAFVIDLRPDLAPNHVGYFIKQARGLTGTVYGRRMYEIMRYWDDDLPDWDAEDRDFAALWRSQRKWVVVALVEVGRTQRHTHRG